MKVKLKFDDFNLRWVHVRDLYPGYVWAFKEEEQSIQVWWALYSELEVIGLSENPGVQNHGTTSNAPLLIPTITY